MPDFDKNLQPVEPLPLPKDSILGENPAFTTPAVPAYAIDETTAGSTGRASNGYSNLANTLSANSEYLLQQTPVSIGTLNANRRWGMYDPSIQNPEEYKAMAQSAWKQWGNGLVKFGAFTLGTFLQSFNTIPSLISSVPKGAEGDLSGAVKATTGLESYENDIDLWRENLENVFPNYMTDWEKEHPFKAAVSFGGAANFWADKFVKNLGFTAGAILGAVAQDVVVGAVTGGIGEIPLLAAQAGRIGKAALALNKLFSSEKRLGQVLQTAQAAGKLGLLEASVGRSIISQGMNATRFGLNLIGASRTEAGVEAREGYRELRSKLVEEYKNENGVEPEGDALKDIEAVSVGALNTRMAINMALLMTSNAIQWDNMLRPFNSSKWGLKSTLSQEIANGGKIKLKGESLDELEAVLPDTFRKKLVQAVKPIVPNIISEGLFEEGGQFAVQKGTYNYYYNKYNKRDAVKAGAWDTVAEILNSTGEGLAAQFGTTEGWENMFLGALTGTFMGVGGNVYNMVANQTKNKLAASAAVDLLNTQGLTGIIDSDINGAVNTIQNKRGIIKAIQNNNIFEFKNLKHKEFFEFINSGLRAGRFDVRMEQLKMLGELKDEEFSKLFGIDPTLENKKLAKEYADQLIAKAEEIRETSNSIEKLFINPFTYKKVFKNEKDVVENVMYNDFENWKSELKYLVSVRKDAESRMVDLENQIGAIVPVDGASIMSIPETVNETKDVVAAVTKIAKQSVPKESEAELTTLVNDYRSLVKRTQAASDIFEALSSREGAEQYFQARLDREIEARGREMKSGQTIVSVQTKDGVKDLEIGKEYFVGEADDRAEMDAMFRGEGRFTITGETEDGRVTIALPDGSTMVISAESLAKLTLGSDEDIMEKANAKFFSQARGMKFAFTPREGGDTLEGFLVYNPSTNRLQFRTLDGKRTYSITRNQFVAKEGEEALIVPLDGEEYSTLAREALSEPVTAQEAEAAFGQRREIISSVSKKLKADLEDVNNKRDAVSKKLEKVAKDLEEKRFENASAAIINNLITSQNTLQESLNKLNDDAGELYSAIAHLTNLLELQEFLPEEFAPLIKEVKEEVATLKDINDATQKSIESAQSLLDAVTNMVRSALKALDDFIKKLKERNPEVPFFSDQLEERLSSYLADPSGDRYVSERLAFKENMEDLQDQIKSFEEGELKLPENKAAVERLKNELQDLQHQFSVDKSLYIRALGTLKAVEEIADRFEKSAEEEKKMQEDPDISKDLEETMNGNEVPIIDPLSYFFEPPKKDAPIVVNSTKVPSEKFSKKPLAEHHKRSNYFGSIFDKIAQTKNIKGIIVTSKNEEQVGLSGLMKHLAGDEAGVDPEKTIALVFVEVDEEGDKHFIDAYGNRIDEGKATVDNTVYQMFPDEGLTWVSGDSMFREGTPIELELRLTLQYKDWRDNTLENPSDKLYVVTPSVGHFITDNILNAEGRTIGLNYNSVEDAGLVNKEDLATKRVIYVPTIVETLEKGNISFEAPAGVPFLELGNKYIPLFSNTITEEQSELLFKALLRIATDAKDGKLKEIESQAIQKWMRSVVYWGTPANEPGKSSIWFTKEDFTLHIGQGDIQFKFTPSELIANKTRITSLLKNLSVNVVASAVNGDNWSSPYTEILDIDDNLKVTKTKQWENYQTYLLSSEGRDADQIPLRTSLRKLTEEPYDANVEGIYFTLGDNDFPYDYSVPEEEGLSPLEEKPPVGKKEEVNEEKEPTITSKLNTDGVTPNIFLSKSGIPISFVYNGKGLNIIEDEKYTELLDKLINDGRSEEVSKKLILDNVVKFVRDTEAAASAVEEEAPVSDIEAKKADIERRRLEELRRTPVADGTAFSYRESSAAKQIDAKYDAELAALEGRPTTAVDSKRAEIEKRRETTFKTFSLEKRKDGKVYEYYLRPDGKTEEVVGDTEEEVRKLINDKYNAELAALGEDNLKDLEERIKRRGFDNPLFREKVLSETERYEKENWNKVVAFLEKAFPNIPVYRVKNMLQSTNGKQYWGMVQDGAIYLSENAEVGTIYHEVFEAVWKMFSTPEEQVKVTEEFKARQGSFEDRVTGREIKYSEATPAEIKEKLAEEFRDYMLKGVKPPRATAKGKSWIATLFNDLVQFIKSFFTGERAKENTRELFAKIGKGYYRKYSPYASQLSFAKVGLQDIEEVFVKDGSDFREKVFNQVQMEDLMQNMTYHAIKQLIVNGESIFKIESMSKAKLYGNIKQRIEEDIYAPAVYAQMLVEQKQKTEKDIQHIVDESKFMLDALETQWEAIKQRHIEVLKAYDVTFDENDEAQITSDEKSRESDWVDPTKVDAFRKMNSAVKLLLSSIRRVNDKGESVVSSVNGVVLLPVMKVYSTLLNTVNGSVSVEDMLKRVRKLAKDDANYRSIYYALTRSDYKSGKLNPDNLKQHDMQLITAFNAVFNRHNPDFKNLYFLSSGDIQVGASNLSTATRAIAFEMGNSVIKAIKQDGKYFKYDGATRMFIGDPASTIGVSLRGLDKQVEFLETLNIEFDKEALKRAFMEKSTYQTKFVEAVNGILDSIRQGKNMMTLNERILSIDGRLKDLAEIQAFIENPEFDTTFFNMFGERSQTYLGQNAVSLLFNQLSSVKDIKELVGTPYSYLLTDDFAKNSTILDKIFKLEKDEKGNIIGGKRRNADKELVLMKYGVASGTGNQENHTAKETSLLTLNQRLIQEINMNLAGYQYLLVPGDASLQSMVYMGNLITPEDISSNNDVVLKTFEGYFKSELLLSRDEGRYIKTAGRRNKTDLRFFKGILGEALHKEIIDESKASPNKSVDEIFEAFKYRIDTAVLKYIDQDVEKQTELLKSYNIIRKKLIKTTGEEIGATATEAENTWSTDSLNFKNKEGMSEESLYLNMKALSVNYIVNNIELHKLLFSDPYQYTEELKRIKNFASPSQYIMSRASNMNGALHRVWNEGYKQGDIGYTDMLKDFFKTVTLEDVYSYNDLPNYDPFEETDGGGIISYKAYRNFRIRASNWNEREEDQYRYDIAYEKKAKGLKLSPEENRLLAKGNPNVTSAYTPIKPKAVGTVLDADGNPSKNNNIVIDKFALYPLSYRLVHQFSPKSNLLKLHEKFTENKIDYGVFNSGRKVGAVEAAPLYNTNGSFNTNPYEANQIVNVPFSILSVQTEVPSKEDILTTRGSQVTKLVTMDFMEAGVPVDFEKGKTFTERYELWNKLKDKESYNDGKNLYKEIKNNEKFLREMISNGYQSLLKRMGLAENPEEKGGFIVVDSSAATETLRQEILKREVNNNVSDALRGLREGEVVLEATPLYQQFRNILYSIVDKQVVSQKISGGLKVQIPSTLLEDVRAEAETLTDSKGNQVVVYKSDVLDFYVNKDGQRVCEVFIAPWFRNPYEGQENAEQKLMDYLNDTEDGQEILRGFAFRIPTQKQNSVDVFKVKKFLPKNFGDSVVVPSALVKKAGSDFDIDKLSMYYKSVYVVGNDIKLVPYYGTGAKAKRQFGKLFDDILKRRIAGTKFALVDKETLLNQIEAVFSEETPKKLVNKILGERGKEIDAFIDSFGDVDIEDVLDSLKQTVAILEQKETEFTNEDLQKAKKAVFIEKMYKKSLENEYIKSCETLASHEENFNNMTKPNSAQQLKNITDDITRRLFLKKPDYNNVDNLLDRSFMTRLRHSFVRGKYAIGIAAIAQTNHSLNQRQLVYIDKNKIGIQDSVEKYWLGDGIINLPHNTIEIERDGKKENVATLSMIKNQAGENISDIISQFIDGYVDISKDTWVMDLGASPNVASTFLFLAKAGVPAEHMAYFMNQPIIRDYLKMIDNAGYSWLYIDSFVDTIKKSSKYSVKVYEDDVIEMPSLDKLKDNIGKNSFETADEKKQQQFILDEFLKYSKMGSQLYTVTQGTNFDTANFNDPFLLFKKMIQLEKAQSSIITDANEILDNSFLGELMNSLGKSRDAMAMFLVSDKGKAREVLQKVLAPYVDLNDRDFVKIAKKAVYTLFDWALQTNKKLNNKITDILLSDEAVARQLSNFVKDVKKDASHPLHDNDIINKLLPDFTPRSGVQNLYFKNKANTVYDQNRIIAGFKELKAYMKDTDMYNRIVDLAILQSGLGSSKYSFTSLLPYEDFVERYNSVLFNLNDINLEQFFQLDMFQRANWNDPDIVFPSRAKWIEDYRTGFMNYNENMKRLPSNMLTDIVGDKIPFAVSMRMLSKEGNYDIISYTWENEKLTADEKKKKRQEGDFSFIYRGLFKKVYRTDNATPLIFVDEDGRPNYVYKLINAYGDGVHAREFYDYVKASVIQNGFINTNTEMTDDQVQSYFIGQDALSTISIVDEAIANAGGVYKSVGFNDEEAAKVLDGKKTVSLRTGKDVDYINIPKGESQIRFVRGTPFIFTNEGEISINQFGGKKAYLEAEGVKDESELSVKLSKDFYNGVAKPTVYTIKPVTKDKVDLTAPVQVNQDDIYSKLGDKTASENVVIKPFVELGKATSAITPEGIVSIRLYTTNEHFGNPFSSDENVLAKVKGLIRAENTKDATVKYINWILTGALPGRVDSNINIEETEKRRQWILNQLNSGELKGRPILYFSERNEPSHATALDYLINKYDWQTSQAPAGVKEQVSNVRYKDKEKRVRIEYPQTIEGLSSELLVKLSDIPFISERIFAPEELFINEKAYVEKTRKEYGDNAADYAKASMEQEEITIDELEFLRDNPLFADSFLDMYYNDEEGYDSGKDIQEYANYLLSQNERLVDTAQLSLFSPDQIQPEGLPPIDNENENNCG